MIGNPALTMPATSGDLRIRNVQPWRRQLVRLTKIDHRRGVGGIDFGKIPNHRKRMSAGERLTRLQPLGIDIGIRNNHRGLKTQLRKRQKYENRQQHKSSDADQR